MRDTCKPEEPLLERIYRVLSASKMMPTPQRTSGSREEILRSLSHKLTKYQDAQVELLVTIKQSRNALDTELRNIARANGRPVPGETE